MNLLILGGTGFFGKSILDCFQKGQLNRYNITSVTVAARNIHDFEKRFPELISPAVHLHKLDLSTALELPSADIIIHAATPTNVSENYSNNHSQNNHLRSSILNFCSIAKTSAKHAKIVYCSSGAVYGQQPENIEKMDEEFDFQNIEHLTSYKKEYTHEKRFAEQQIIELSNLGLNVSIARCFSFFGPYLPKDQHFAYGNFIDAAERGEPILVKANHQVVRSYMHADDLVHSLIQVALHSNTHCPIYNVGSDKPIEIRQLANNIAQKYQVPLKLTPITNHYIDRYVPNINKLKSIINFEIK